MLISTLSLIFIIGILAIIFLQNYKFIFVRSLGLIIILLGIIGYYLILSKYNFVVLTSVTLLTLIGIIFDLLNATFKTWGYKASNLGYWGAIIGGFIGIILSMLFKSFLISFILGTFIGAYIGELKNHSNRILQKTIGIFANLFGMGIKLLMGLTIIELFLLIG